MESSQYGAAAMHREPVLSEHLGPQYKRRFLNPFKRYLGQPGRVKYFAIGGLSVSMKSSLVDEIAETAINEFGMEAIYMKTGDALTLGRNRARFPQRAEGKPDHRHYDDASGNAGAFLTVGTDLVLRHADPQSRFVVIAEGVYTTGVPDHTRRVVLGVNRMMPWIMSAVANGGFGLLTNTPPEVVAKGLSMRNFIAEFPERDLPTLNIRLQELFGVEDLREPREIVKYNANTGDEQTRQNQDQDVNEVMFRLVQAGRLKQPPFILESPDSFNANLTKRNRYIEKVYYPFLFTTIPGYDPRRCRVVPVRMLPEDTHIQMTRVLEESNLINRLQNLWSDLANIERETLRFMGMTTL